MNRKCAAVGIALVCCAAAVAAAEEVWVKRPSLNIREGKGAAFATVATARQGDKLSVVGHEGKWLKVQLGDKQGYVYEDSISAREIKARAALGGPDTSALAADAAAKGLEPQAIAYAQNKNLSSAPLEKMIARRNAISGQQWIAFTSEGKVGPGKQ
jgi:uncharacterized protein YgiM (DUF1202 family)